MSRIEVLGPVREVVLGQQDLANGHAALLEQVGVYPDQLALPDRGDGL